MADKNVIIMMADGLEECEALNVVDVLRRAGIDLKMVSINGKKHVDGSHGIGIDTDLDLSDLLPDGVEGAATLADKLDMVILPGGMPGTKYLGSDARLIGLIAEMDKREKWLTAICAAPTVYAQAGLLTGRKATCYPALLDVLDEHGADVSEEKVVIDGHFVTSRGLGTAMSFGLTLTKVLISQEKAEEVRADIVSTDEIF